jgi:hypothetical protein
MQRYTIFFITVNVLHTSGGFSTHHQELKTVHTASGICRALLLLTAIVSELEQFQLTAIVSELEQFQLTAIVSELELFQLTAIVSELEQFQLTHDSGKKQ